MELEQAKQFLRDNWEQGAECPCCHQFVKRYRRKLNRGMAQFLIRLWIRTREGYNPEKGGRWVHSAEFQDLMYNRDYSKLHWWGLIEPHPNSREEALPDRSSNGLWRITPLGVEFVLRRTRVPSHSLSFNKKVYGFEGNQIDIIEALGKKFNYAELMAGG